jgi:HK97 family phage major capsid protein
MSVTAMPQSRERLDVIRARLGEARDRRAAAQRAVDAAEQAGDNEARHAATVALQQSLGEIERDQELVNVLVSQIAGISGAGFDSSSMFDDPRALQDLQAVVNASRPVEQPLGPMMSREQFLAVIESGSWHQPALAISDGTTDYSGVSGRTGPLAPTVQQARRQIRLLDLIPSVAAEQNVIPYLIEGGSLTDAAPTAEGALKPAGTLTLTDALATCQTIAVWVKSTRQQLSDISGLQSLIQQRLTFEVSSEIENQALSGNGTAPNLRGILGTTGVADVDFVTGTSPIDMVLAGLRTVILSFGMPDGIVLHPNDWATAISSKAETSGVYLASPSPFGAQVEQLWGVPVVVSAIATPGQAIVADFRNSCQLFIREAPSLTVGLDSDDLVRNRVTSLVEARVGFAVTRPALIATVALA